MKHRYNIREDLEESYEPLIHDGREYLPSGFYLKAYCLSHSELKAARDNGLPGIKKDTRSYYYNKQDFHDYYAGKIGKDVEG